MRLSPTKPSQLNLFESLGQKIAGLLGEKALNTDERWRSLMEHYSLGSFLPYESFDPDTGLFFNRHSTGFVVEMDAIVGCDDSQQKMMARLFDLPPEGSALQFGLWADPHLQSDLEVWKQARTSGLHRTLSERRSTFLQHTLPLRQFRVWMSYTQKGMAHTAMEQNRILTLKERMEGILKASGIHPRSWHASDLLTYIHGLFDLKKDRRLRLWNRLDPLNHQIVDEDFQMKVMPQELRVCEDYPDAFKIRTYRLSTGPKLWAQGAMQLLIGDPFEDRLTLSCPFLMHSGIFVPSQDGLKKVMEHKGSWVEKQALSPIAKYIPSIRDEYEEHQFVRHQVARGSKFVKTSWNLTLLAPPHRMEQEEQTAISLFRAQEWHLVPDRYTVFPKLLAQMPMTWDAPLVSDLQKLQAIKTSLSSESANLVPLQGEWKGTPSQGVMLVGRRGQLFRWHPFDNREGNYNVCVAGYSGSGKSVFMQEMLSTLLGLGGRVFVMDVGRSFRNTCHVLGGQFMEFDQNAQFSLNPFDGAGGDAHTLSMITTLLCMMIAPSSGLSDLERAFVEKAVSVVMSLPHPCIDGVVHILQEDQDPRAKDLSLVLSRYGKTGIYGAYFHEGPKLEFNNPLVVMELEELKGKPDLQAVIFQTVILAVTHQMVTMGRKQPFYIIMDEAWDLLRGEQAGQFIEMLARRLRKYNGSLVVGTQNLSDFQSSPAAEAAFANASWLCLLAQKDEEIARAFAEQGGVFPSDQTALRKMLQSVHTRHGVFSEVCMKGPQGFAVGRLYLDPFSKLLYSTTPHDWERIQALNAQGLTVTEAIEHLLEPHSTKPHQEKHHEEIRDAS